MIDDAIREKRHRDLADDAEAGFDTTAKEDALLRQSRPEVDVTSRQPGNKSGRRGSAFYGDDGNNVDFSQRHAPSLAPEMSDEEKQAEEEEFAGLPAWAALHPTKHGLLDPEKRTRFWEYQRKKENGELEPKKTQAPEDEPMLSKAADDKFWNDPKEQQKFTRKKL
jgi:hypothetical protein